MTLQAPKGLLPHIVLAGKRNVGKSSLLNALTQQDLSIVSDLAGTTTDPVEKTFELQPFGPIVFIDTAGLDDTGALGQQRIEKSKHRLDAADLVLFVVDEPPSDNETMQLFTQLESKHSFNLLLVVNKCDQIKDPSSLRSEWGSRTSLSPLFVSCLTGEGIELLRESLISALDSRRPLPLLLADLVTPPNLVVLVIPIDKEAPQGRLILPQVQALRELLDNDITSLVVNERELGYSLKHNLKTQPSLVVTDSQAFLKVVADIPANVPLTSFSILLARQKGDLVTYIKGAQFIPQLKNGDKILIAELCSHRPISEDIGRIKIPRWLRQHTGKDLIFDIASGKETPQDLSDYSLIIQCGGCVANRTLIQSRIQQATAAGVAITNYGLCIAYLHGILERSIQPFPEALHAFNNP